MIHSKLKVIDRLREVTASLNFLFIYLLVCFSISNLGATPAGCPCTIKGIALSSVTFTLTTKTTLGNSVDIQDPSSLIIGYVKAKAQDKATEAATKRSSFLATISAAWTTGTAYARNIGLIAENVSSAKLIVDEISMEISFDCCDGAYATPQTARAAEEALFLELLNPSAVRKLPNLYVKVMVDAASDMVSNCPK